MIRKSIASAFLLASFVTTPALAEEPASEPNGYPLLVPVVATIELGDLDLGTPAGISELHRRTRLAAMEMCRPEAAPAGRGRLDGHCLRQAMQNARPQIEQAIAVRNRNMLAAREGSPRGAIDD